MEEITLLSAKAELLHNFTIITIFKLYATLPSAGNRGQSLGQSCALRSVDLLVDSFRQFIFEFLVSFVGFVVSTVADVCPVVSF